MKKIRVKICGITRESDLKTAVDAGADALGFVIGVSSSPRNLTIDKVKELLSKVPVFVETVVVAVPESLGTLLMLDKKLSPDALQIHGEAIDLNKIRKGFFRAKLIKAATVRDGKINCNINNIKLIDAILLDSFSETKYGGTGAVHNWNMSRKFREKIYPKPLILAGGLTPKNVIKAISIVKPYAVDVSTGVENRPGIKDTDKVFQFIKKVKEVSLSN